MIQGVRELCLSCHADARGKLVAIEGRKDLPFDIRRIYYIYGTSPDAVRGRHAHRDLNQVLLCVSGSCEILLDNGSERQVVRLDSPDRGLYLYGFIWREMRNFSPDCVLLALVDRPYDPADYVYDYALVAEKGEKAGQ